MKKPVTVFSVILIATLVVVDFAAAQSRTAFKPGTYTAEAEGFYGPFTVSVTVDASKIVDIKIGENEETEGVGSEALKVIPKTVIASQSLAVDVVSGATYTSIGLLDALGKALAEAGGNIEALRSGK
jgi:uncharacterized protein with FMN-binding domain